MDRKKHVGTLTRYTTILVNCCDSGNGFMYMYLIQGSPQYVTISLPASAVVKEVHIRFQGGFVGSECALMAGDSELELEEIDRFYPKDNNSLQVSFL